MSLKTKCLLLFLVVLSSCVATKSIQTDKSFELGYYSTFSMLGGQGYEFIDDSIVIYKWYSDLTSFERKGTYFLNNDTIEIQYTPLIKWANLGVRKTFTELQLKNFENQNLVDFPVKIFFGDQSKQILSDSEGRVRIDKKIAEIDSIYFDWRFEELGIYPIDNKFVPKKDDLKTGYSALEVFIAEDLIDHPIKRNDDKLLVIGRNQIFNGLNYNPNVVYIGGILKKK